MVWAQAMEPSSISNANLTLLSFFGQYNDACITCHSAVVKLKECVYSVSPVIIASDSPLGRTHKRQRLMTQRGRNKRGGL